MSNRLIAPNRGESILSGFPSNASRSASPRLQAFLEEVERLLNASMEADAETDILSGNADAKATLALGLIERLAELAERSALLPLIEPEDSDDSLLPALADVSPFEDISPAPEPIEGATGTFTTSDPYTVTVVNGIITDIS